MEKKIPHRLNPSLLIVVIQGIRAGKIYERSEQQTKVMKKTNRAGEIS